jgi:hypothetical protein
MKHVVSVSLGAKSRDTDQTVTILGEEVRLERRGTDGDLKAAAAMIRELDGKVDAIGLGGIDLYLYVDDTRYTIRDAARLAAQAKVTPVVCGAALKRSLEHHVVESLNTRFDWRGKKVLMVSAADRFGMAKSFAASGAEMLYGDIIFAIGLPIPLHSVEALRTLAHLFLPIVCRVPFKWIYPTGSQQEKAPSDKYARYYRWADVIAGDWHFIKRYTPASLSGKVILTNTTTAADVAMLRERGAEALITTTPRFSGRSLPTNLLEAALIAVSGRFPLADADYRQLLAEAELEPDVLELQPAPAASGN